MKVLFFGTSEFAVPSLEVAAQRTDLRGVVTQPDRPAGRGQKLRSSPVKIAAEKLGLRVYQPASLRGFDRDLAGEQFDLFVLASYGKIIPQALLELPALGSLNVHPSLLPQYRGATPIQSALRDGATETGVTIMLMDGGLDTGDVVLQERTPILPDETYGELHDRLAYFGAQALGHAIDSAHGGTLPRAPQTGTPTMTRPLRKEDLAIDWSWDAKRIVNLVRSLSPQPAARATIAGVPVKILQAREGLSGEAMVVPCGDGAVSILKVIAPNRGPQTGAAFAASLR